MGSDELLKEYGEALDDADELPFFIDEHEVLHGVNQLLDFLDDRVFDDGPAALAQRIALLNAVEDAAAAERRRIYRASPPGLIDEAALFMRPAASDARN